MGRFDGYLICSDVDGTVAKGTEVPLRNLEAIAYFQSEGGRFTLSTGRPAGYEKNFPFRLNAPMITENGARVYDPVTEKTLKTYPLENFGDLLAWLDSTLPLLGHDRVSVCFADAYRTVPAGRAAATAALCTSVELLKVVCPSSPSEEEALAFMTEAKARFGNRFGINRSWATGVEFISPSGGKGSCISYLRSYLGDAVHTVIAAGDFENDLSMLRAADRSFAPSNACSAVLNEADTVLCSCGEGAVGALIELLDREIF